MVGYRATSFYCQNQSDGRSKNCVYVVGTDESKGGLVPEQTRVEQRSDDPTAIPRSIDSFEIKGNTISIDAIGY